MEELAASGVLNRQQRIGVKYYQDFQERMLRDEVSEIEEKVRYYYSTVHDLVPCTPFTVCVFSLCVSDCGYLLQSVFYKWSGSG